MPNTIDEVMKLSPMELMGQPEAIDQVIAYQRKARANFDSGIKPKKGESRVFLDTKGFLEKLGLAPKAPTVKRRKFK